MKIRFTYALRATGAYLGAGALVFGVLMLEFIPHGLANPGDPIVFSFGLLLLLLWAAPWSFVVDTHNLDAVMPSSLVLGMLSRMALVGAPNVLLLFLAAFSYENLREHVTGRRTSDRRRNLLAVLLTIVIVFVAGLSLYHVLLK